ncbi:MAG: hypothetical protein A3I05_04660 [Deltaproteobacteria bacterium RIFCSPLOWO2_02_FULL_44_10]|nr:MAG: hypothetical protein A3C46_07465 [Deltaproteobacteria bacterium RIFCSPHIGHO2_02_FULL_44_16]OGQ46648.1 MAG: hypothetical protein A3I05_04660 [Deltaproteobacteria bacterium RIFCSPLOWO2_02_FULL_44_10]
MPLLTTHQVSKRYDEGRAAVGVLKEINFSLAERECVGIFGVSGAGKSTFLHLLGGLDTPTSGKVFFEGQDLFSLNDEERARFRNTTVGFVFQFYHLLSEFSALENVMIPCLIAGNSRSQAEEKAQEALAAVGLTDRFHHRPGELSGGEQQRVAIARAVVMRPRVILADEPTGNLDEQTGKKIWDYLLRLAHEGMALVVVSHNQELLRSLPRHLELKEGSLHEATL